MDLLFTPQSGNMKTGNIPQGWVGKTRAATWWSCNGCRLGLLGICYAWLGRGPGSLAAVQRGAARSPERYTLDSALAWRSRLARGFRLFAIGDGGRMPVKQLHELRNKIITAGLIPLAYTHHWKELRSPLKKAVFLASCDDLVEADQAIDAGWKVATVVPADQAGPVVVTPTGRKLLKCPAITNEDKPRHLTCNDCLLCSPGQLHRYDGVVFPVHGQGARKYQV